MRRFYRVELVILEVSVYERTAGDLITDIDIEHVNAETMAEFDALGEAEEFTKAINKRLEEGK